MEDIPTSSISICCYMSVATPKLFTNFSRVDTLYYFHVQRNVFEIFLHFRYLILNWNVLLNLTPTKVFWRCSALLTCIHVMP